MSASGVSTWDELVAAATVGTDTRTPNIADAPHPVRDPADQVSTEDPAGQLLDVAALLTIARRAGQLPQPAPDPLFPPAGAEERPALSADAARVLQLLGQRGAALLADALHDIAEAGYRLPEPLLAEYLAAGTRSIELRPRIEPVLGRRGRWLAAQNPAWRWVGVVIDVSDDPEVWRTGTAAERRAWLAAARRADPSDARELLAAGWAAEPPDQRADLLALLRADLNPADEPFLERVLDDRRAEVREAARSLLALLPHSALNRRRAERASRAVRLEQRLLRRRLRVELPKECDAAMVRDGIPPTAPANAGVGARHFWFREVVAAAPLVSWPLPPAELLSLSAVDTDGADDSAEFRQGLVAAVLRQGSAEWARVLLASQQPPAELNVVTGLLTVLPPADRVALVESWLPRADLDVLPVLAELRPWPASLGVAVVRQLSKHTPVEQGPIFGALSLIARRLPAERRPEWDAAASLYDLSSTQPADSRWRRALTEAAETVMLRRRLLEEMP